MLVLNKVFQDQKLTFSSLSRLFWYPIVNSFGWTSGTTLLDDQAVESWGEASESLQWCANTAEFDLVLQTGDIEVDVCRTDCLFEELVNGSICRMLQVFDFGWVEDGGHISWKCNILNLITCDSKLCRWNRSFSVITNVYCNRDPKNLIRSITDKVADTIWIVNIWSGRCLRPSKFGS